MQAGIFAALLWGTALAQTPAPSPPVHEGGAVPAPAPESDAQRFQRLKALVEAAEKAMESGDEEEAAARCEEAEVLTADWPPALLARPDVQGLLQRLKDLEDQIEETPQEGQEGAAAGEAEPGLKAHEEVVTISGAELRAELERVRAAEQGASYDFPIDLNDKVLTWVNVFTTTKRGFMENALSRATAYLPMIRQVFAEEGVPSDLAYLAVIESGFRNEAKSRAKAVGMWQFIRSTGRIYGLTGNAWLEERRDPVKASRAAARYLKRLYEVTGDWYLAVSSYNAGPLTLERAIMNTGTRNFWDLARSRWLRTETKNYVPELCAAILIGRNPDRYGLNLLPAEPYAYETVTVRSATSLSLLARCAGTTTSSLKALNPELLRGSTPPGSYVLRVPPGKAIDCLRQLARMPAGQRLDFRTYTVRKGDTLAKVAKRFKLPPEDLLEANGITAGQFRPGRRLQVPPPPPMALEERDIASGGAGRKALEDSPLPPLPVVPRDLDAPKAAAPASAGSVVPAEREPSPSASPARENQTLADGGRKPSSEGSVSSPETDSAAVKRVRAQSGDTLAKLARAHEVPLGELMRLNPEAVKVLHPGDWVRLPQGSSGAGVRGVHRIRKGETLFSVARKYGLDPADLRAWNRLEGNRVRTGQRLRLSPQ